jgi:hypothetical protein
MANKKISQLTGATTPLTGTEELAIVQGGQSVKATAQDVADLGGGGTLPVETVYPTTDALKAGTRFWYKGNEWHYMTQDEIDSTGWTGLVSVGFPAPVDKSFNLEILYDSEYWNVSGGGIQQSSLLGGGAIAVDFVGVGANKINIFAIGSVSINSQTIFRNAVLLANIKNEGTTNALNLINSQFSATSLNSLFTQLPITINTSTIDVRNNPGAATCDPTIATAKGYTVITS